MTENGGVAGSRERILASVAIGAIKVYKIAVSPVLGPACRFYPSCSSYAIEAIGKYGLWRGTILSIKRIMRCHPLHPGGYDPVE